MKTTFTRRIVAAISAAGLLLVGAPLAAGPAQARPRPARRAPPARAPSRAPSARRPSPSRCRPSSTAPCSCTATATASPRRSRQPSRCRSASRRAPRTRRSRSRPSRRSSAPTSPTSGPATAEVAPTPRRRADAARRRATPWPASATRGRAGRSPSPSRPTSSSSSTSRPAPSRASRRSWRGATRSAGSRRRPSPRGTSARSTASCPTARRSPGPEAAMNTAMTVLFTWKTLIAPSLRVANYTSYAQALTDLATVLQTLNGVGTGTVSTSSVGYPVAQANLLGGLMARSAHRVRGLRRHHPEPGLRHPRHGRGAGRRLPAGLRGRELRSGHAPERRRCRRPGRHGPLRPRAEGPSHGGHPGHRVGELHRQRLVSYTALLSRRAARRVRRHAERDHGAAERAQRDARQARLVEGRRRVPLPGQPEGGQGDPGPAGAEGRVHACPR